MKIEPQEANISFMSKPQKIYLILVDRNMTV